MSLVPQTPRKKDTVPSGSLVSTQAGRQASHFGTADLLSMQFHFLTVLRYVSKLPDFVEPSPSDIILCGIPDPDSPSAPPRINPWSEDYFIGDVNITI